MKILKEYIFSLLREAEGDWLIKEIELITMQQETLTVLIDHLQDRGFSLYYSDRFNKDYIRLKKEYYSKFSIVIFTGMSKLGHFGSHHVLFELHKMTPENVKQAFDVEYVAYPKTEGEVSLFFNEVNETIEQFEEIIEKIETQSQQ